MLGGDEASSSMGGPAATSALSSNPYADDEIDPSFLQRSISAPPATDHALSQGADRLSLDYYYYYYQPNSLNPRLPNKAVPSAPGLGPAASSGGGKPGAWSTQDDSVLSSTHFPQPSKPMAFSSSLVDDYVASLTADNAASSSSSPPSSQQGGASSQPQASAPLHAPLPGPAPVDVLPLRPSPIGTRLPTTEDSKQAKSLMELIQEDFPRTPSPVYHSTPNPANVAQAISLGMATANGLAGGPSQAGSGGAGGKLSVSPTRSNTAAYVGGPPPQGGGGSAGSQQAQAQPGPAPARATGGPGATLPPRSHHKSHSAGNLLAASMQGLSLATPAEDMLGSSVHPPGPSVVPDLGLGQAAMRGHHHHPADIDSHLAAARQQQQRVMYHPHHPSQQPPLHDHPASSVAGPPGVEFAAGPQGSGGYLLAGGAAPMYATAEQPVYFRVAPQAGGPYRHQEQLMYARVPTEYVTTTGAEMRLHPEQYVSVIPMPASSAGGGQGYPTPHHQQLSSWGGPAHAPHGQRLVAAPPPPFATGPRDVAGGPGGAARLAFPYHPVGGHHPPVHHAASASDVFSHGRLQQEAHERGYKLVPKDMPLGGHHHRGHHDLDGRDGMKRSGGGRHLRERERAMGGVTSSSTLDEFRNNTKNRPWDIRDISGDIVEFCQDQHGSRFIQQKLEMASDEEKELIFKEVLPRAHTLMTDVFGNYVIQKVLEHGTTEQRDVIASILTGHAVQLALQMYGCRVVQKALEVIGVQRLLSLVAEFEGHVLKCVHDQNGNHVIQKCIEVLSLKTKESPEYASFLLPQVDFIVQAFVGQVEKFSTHPYGCRVIQRILEHCTGTQKNVILDEIRKCTGTLIQDQYGNYVIQHVMKHGRPQDRQMVINEVKSRMLLYSQHKFASNVVEKCLQYGSKAERNDIIEEVVRSVLEKSSLLQVMVRDPYGNYVVQKILDIADDRQQEALCSYLKHHAAQLKRYTYGKHILVRLEKISGEKML